MSDKTVNILNDGSLLERLSAGASDSDMSGDEIFVLLSALDFAAIRCEQKGEHEGARRLRCMMSDSGYVIQSVSDRYGIGISDLYLSPSGDLCIGKAYCQDTEGLILTVIAARSMLPLMSIPSEERHLLNMAVSEDSSYLALCNHYGIRVWDLRSLRIAYETEVSIGGWAYLSWSPDSHLLACSCSKGLHVIDIRKGDARHFFFRRVLGKCGVNDGGTVLCSSDKGLLIVDVTKDRRIPVPGTGPASYVYAEGAGFGVLESDRILSMDARGNMISVVELEPGITGDGIESFYDMSAPFETPWAFAGRSPDGTLSMMKAETVPGEDGCGSLKVRFGIMHPGGGLRELGPEGGSLIVPGPLRGSRIRMRRNDTVRVEIDSRGNRSAVFERMGAEGPCRRRVLRPGPGRTESEVRPIGGGRYVVCTAEPGRKGRPLLRIMDSESGGPLSRVLGYDEGQLFGPAGSALKDGCSVLLLDGGRYLAAEMVSDRQWIVCTWDVVSGRRYPEDGTQVEGRIIGHDEGSLTVGILDGHIMRSAVIYDSRMNGIGGYMLDIHMHSDERPVYQKDTTLRPGTGHGLDWKHAVFPLNSMGLPVDRQVPVFVVQGDPVRCSDDIPYPKPGRRLNYFFEYDSMVMQRCTMCTIRSGKISDPVDTELMLMVHTGTANRRGWTNRSLRYSVCLYRAGDRYWIAQLYRVNAHYDSVYVFRDTSDGSEIRPVPYDRITGRDPGSVYGGKLSYILSTDRGCFLYEDGKEMFKVPYASDHSSSVLLSAGRMWATAVGDRVIFISRDGRRAAGRAEGGKDLRAEELPDGSVAVFSSGHRQDSVMVCSPDMELTHVSADPGIPGLGFLFGTECMVRAGGMFVLRRRSPMS